MIELLSPAKDKETAIAAIDCGADAIYMGAPAFGARKAVPNSLEDIKEVVDYAHKFWAKVYITMNTILTDEELDKAVQIAKNLDKIGVDALIIQDMGLLYRLKDSSLPLHISTQCDNYLPQKIKFFNDIGIPRVVLARELSLDSIKQIHRENPDLELEGFVHGALCVSMSGQCYLSQYIGGRSANRGECAQPCRKRYSVETTEGEIIKKDIHALCLKDFNASKCLEELIDAGICSLKIEGRLKDIGYVKNITAYYAQRLKNKSSSGKSIYPFEPNPEKSFNRGFTEYFLKGREECFNFESPKSRGEYLGKVIEVKNDCFKIKTDKEIHPQDGIYFDGKGFKVNKTINGWVYPNKGVNIRVGEEIYRNFDSEFEKQLTKPVKRQIGLGVGVNGVNVNGVNVNGLNKNSKSNAGVNVDNVLVLTDEDGISITLPLPEGEKANNPQKMEETFVKQFNKTGEGDFYIKDIKIAAELPFLPVSTINQLRREAFEKLMQKRLSEYKREVQKPITLKKYFLDEVDYRANVHNKSAKEFYEKCGVKVLEPSFETQKPQRQVELMRCKHCIKYALNMCKSPKNLVLKDEFGKTYQLKFNCKDCEMSVLSH